MRIPNSEDKNVRSKLEKDTCVLIFTYANQNKRLVKVLQKLNEIDIYKIVSYNYRNIPPNPDVYKLSESVVTTHQTPHNVNYPWFWHMNNTSGLISKMNFKYAFLICGDTYIGKPERIWDLPELLGDNDLLSYAYIKVAIGTFMWFTRVPALLEIVSWINENFEGPGSAVGVKVRLAVKDRDLKLMHYDDAEEYRRFVASSRKRERLTKIRKVPPKKSWLVEYLDAEHLL